eukprot:1156975-Pelagomonas_calceolata.AAC.6
MRTIPSLGTPFVGRTQPFLEAALRLCSKYREMRWLTSKPQVARSNTLSPWTSKTKGHTRAKCREMLSAPKIPMQAFIGDLRYRHQKVWKEADALSPRGVDRRKAVTYHHWCGKPFIQTARTPFCIPSYLLKDLDKG